MLQVTQSSGVQKAYRKTLENNSHTRTSIMHSKPYGISVHLINPQDLGNKIVNLLLRVSVALQGQLHIMQDERRDVGWLYHSNWPHGARYSLPARLQVILCQWSIDFPHCQLTLFPLSSEENCWEEKKGLPVIDWSTALLYSGYKLREMREGGEQGGRDERRMKMV